jgi:hypothetical protein
MSGATGKWRLVASNRSVSESSGDAPRRSARAGSKSKGRDRRFLLLQADEKSASPFSNPALRGMVRDVHFWTVRPAYIR